jgi:retinol-binding protein 3
MDATPLINKVCELIEAQYVFPNVAQEIAAMLRDRLAAGEYKAIATYDAFAERITADLRTVNGDKHLVVSRISPRQREAANTEESFERRVELMREHNFGFEDTRLLDENIGYLKITAFIEAWYPGAGDAAIEAMTQVTGADCLIFDLRENGGGHPTMIQLLMTYLFEGEPRHLSSFYLRETDSEKQFWTLPHVPGKRMPNVPVYVLTSRDTFSGAEEFSYNTKVMKRGMVVGEVTGGGAHPGGEHPLDEALEIFIPDGRAINPVTQTNWEGVGVEPDILCDAADALNRALAHYHEQGG